MNTIKFDKEPLFFENFGKVANISIKKFADVSESLVQTYSEDKREMFEACSAARNFGATLEKLCSAIVDKKIGQMYNYKIVWCAQSLFSFITRILLVADNVMLNQVFIIEDELQISKRLKTVINFTKFVKSFSDFGYKTIELSQLLFKPQKDSEAKRRKAEIDCANQILERSITLLLSASKTFFQHLDCDIAKENVETVFNQIRNAMSLIYCNIKDRILSMIYLYLNINTSYIPQNYNEVTPLKHFGSSNSINQFHCNQKTKDLCLTALSAIQKFENIVKMSRLKIDRRAYRADLLSTLNVLIERSQEFTDSAYIKNEHREEILQLVEQIKLKLRHLMQFSSCLTDQNDLNENFETSIKQTLIITNDIKNQLKITALDQAQELFQLTVELDIINRLRNFSTAGDQKRLDDYSEKFFEHCDHLQEVCKLLHHVSINETFEVSFKTIESTVVTFSHQVINACNILCIHSNSKVAKINLDIFLYHWILFYKNIHSASGDIKDLFLDSSKFRYNFLSITNQSYFKSQRAVSNQSLNLFSNELKYIKSLDKKEQSKTAKAELEMKKGSCELDAEAKKCPNLDDNEIIRKVKALSKMAFLIYQFTRGKGKLKNTQDFFTQAEFFAEKANKFYKLVRHFSYQVPRGQLKKELLEHLDKVPIFVQRLQFTVKNPTVGKAATFTKVDNVIKETKNLMDYVSHTVNSCLSCSSKYKLNMKITKLHLSTNERNFEDEPFFENTIFCGMNFKTTPAASLELKRWQFGYGSRKARFF